MKIENVCEREEIGMKRADENGMSILQLSSIFSPLSLSLRHSFIPCSRIHCKLQRSVHMVDCFREKLELLLLLFVATRM
jgi:hypothetical protein